MAELANALYNWILWKVNKKVVKLITLSMHQFLETGFFFDYTRVRKSEKENHFF